MYGVIGLGNSKLKGKFRTTFDKNANDKDLDFELKLSAPGIEYQEIGLFLGNIIQVIRISMGDYAAITSSDYLTEKENYLFWFIWIITTAVTNIVFLNFIVAEASASYNEVSG